MRHLFLHSSVMVMMLGAGSALAQPTWNGHGVVASGNQFDVVTDGEQRIYLVSDVFAELDGAASVLATDGSVGDGHQGDLEFPPAIALGPDGSIHVITRHGGDFSSGFDLRYRRRNASGAWDVDLAVGENVARNYVVGVAALDDGRVFFAHSRNVQDVNATISFYELTGGTETALGAFSDSSWLRSDADFRMRASGNRVVLASGSPWPDGKVHYFAAEPGGDLVGALAASRQAHQSGSGRRGMPDLFVDDSGRVSLSYGSLHEVYFNRYVNTAAELSSDARLFDGLGDWHLALGLSAIGGTPDGQNLLSVALVANGSQQASDSDLLFSYASGGSGSWSTPEDTGVNTNGGEGRLRPRVVGVGNLVHVFYRDSGQSGVSVGTVEFDGDTGGSAGAAGAGGGSAGASGAGGGAGAAGSVNGGSGGVGGSPTGGSGGTGGSGIGGTTGATGGNTSTGSGSMGDDDGGCGCRLGGRSKTSHSALVLLLLALVASRRRLCSASNGERRSHGA